MSIIRKFDEFNEECVVAFPSEGDERMYMPLCGITRCKPGYKIVREISKEYIFEYIITGNGLFQTENQVFHPGPDDLYIAHMGSTHCYQTSPNNCWTKVWFNFQGTLVPELMKLYHLEDVYYVHQSGLRELFEESLFTIRNHLENTHELATLIAHKLIYRISQIVYAETPISNPIARELKKWIEDHVAGVIRLEELSQHFGYSESQLIRIFSQEYQETPYQYFLKKKLDLAFLMLRNTQKTIKDIAYELQFTDPYYFSGLFKRKFGSSPRQARRQEK